MKVVACPSPLLHHVSGPDVYQWRDIEAFFSLHLKEYSSHFCFASRTDEVPHLETALLASRSERREEIPGEVQS